MTKSFNIKSDFKPAGDQPNAIKTIVEGLNSGLLNQTLRGVTGSGKTFAMANIIQEVQRPAIVMAHNKTLPAQLYGEFKEFFPENAVEYFVSYYDYYNQKLMYLPQIRSLKRTLLLMSISNRCVYLQQKQSWKGGM